MKIDVSKRMKELINLKRQLDLKGQPDKHGEPADVVIADVDIKKSLRQFIDELKKRKFDESNLESDVATEFARVILDAPSIDEELALTLSSELYGADQRIRNFL